MRFLIPRPPYFLGKQTLDQATEWDWLPQKKSLDIELILLIVFLEQGKHDIKWFGMPEIVELIRVSFPALEVN